MTQRTPEEQEAIRQAVSVLGSLKSERKAQASRENGKKGGRPKKSKEGEEPKKKQDAQEGGGES